MPLRKDSQMEKLSAPIFKWEFIRRNQKYKADYEKYIPSKYEQQQKQYFYKEYGMGIPFDPGMSFDEHLKQRLKGYKEASPQKRTLRWLITAKKMIRQMFPYDSSVLCLNPHKVKISLNQISSQIFGTGKIEVEIDVQRPVQEIISDMEFVVKTAREVLGIKEVVRDDRNQWALYRDYLRFYDMKYKEGKTIQQISEHFNDGKIGIDDKIKKSLKAAEKMVNGDFRKIVNIPIPL